MINKTYTVEYYYKARWGYAEEFFQLFKKNHLPVLLKLKELGRILSIKIEKPHFHTAEDGRWDYRVTIVWKNINFLNDGFDEKTISRRLFPDQKKFKKEEQRRFEILLAHWDLPIKEINIV